MLAAPFWIPSQFGWKIYNNSGESKKKICLFVAHIPTVSLMGAFFTGEQKKTNCWKFRSYENGVFFLFVQTVALFRFKLYLSAGNIHYTMLSVQCTFHLIKYSLSSRPANTHPQKTENRHTNMKRVENFHCTLQWSGITTCSRLGKKNVIMI